MAEWSKRISSVGIGLQLAGGRKANFGGLAEAHFRIRKQNGTHITSLDTFFPN